MSRIQRRFQFLLGVAVLGAAGTFLGGDEWLGIDLGATGAALLYIALWLIVIHLARHASEAFPEEWAPIGVLIFGWIVVASMLRRQVVGEVALDERDLRIAHSAARRADGGLSLLIACLVVTLVVLPEHSRTWLHPMVAANVLIALLIARALVENIYTVLRYRRERG